MVANPAAESTRGPYRNGVRRRELIRRQASEVFAERGYAGGSLRAIAARVDVSPASVIQHFGSKEGLLMAVLDDWEERTARLTSTDRVGLDFFESLGDLMRFHVAHPGLLELFLTLATEATRDDHPANEFVHRRYDAIRLLWSTHLREAAQLGQIGLSDAQIDEEVRLLAAIADGLELQWLLDPQVDLVGLFQRYLRSAIDRWTATRPALTDSRRTR